METGGGGVWFFCSPNLPHYFEDNVSTILSLILACVIIKFGRVRQVPIWEFSWEFPGWDLSHFAKFGIFMGIL